MRVSAPLRLPARMPRRLLQLYVGLVLYGISMGLFVRSRLGAMPWDVLHQGLSRQVGGTIGQWSIGIGALVLIAWIPLRERPGLGTLSNVLVIGVIIDVTLALMPTPEHFALRVLCATSGLLLNGVATALYIGARLGPGPRDGLMTGLVRRTGASVRLVRTSIEALVVTAGWLLGGTLGFATLGYVLGIGPLVQLLLPLLHVQPAPTPAAADEPDTLAA